MVFMVYPYKPEDAEVIRTWLLKRELQPSMADELPRIGYLVYHQDTPVCAAFIRQCEGGIAGLYDSLITNPDSAPEVRNQALDIATKTLINKAKELKLKVLMAFSKDNNTLVRSYRHGFVLTPHSVISLGLESD